MGIDVSMIMPMTDTMENQIDIKRDRDIERMIQEEEDEDLIHQIVKQNTPYCFCFKKKIKKDMYELVTS